MANRKRSVLVLSDQVLFRQALAAALRSEGFLVTEQAPTQSVRNHKRAEVCVLDLHCIKSDTSSVVDELHDLLPDSRLILIGSATRMAASVDGDADAELELPGVDMATLRSAIQGRTPSASTGLVKAHRLWSQVTRRQREVLRWLAHGLDNPGIAAKLRVGTRAIKAHISALLALFGLDSRTQLALIAYEGGLKPA